MLGPKIGVPVSVLGASEYFYMGLALFLDSYVLAVDDVSEILKLVDTKSTFFEIQAQLSFAETPKDFL